jgi:hypothetical protein
MQRNIEDTEPRRHLEKRFGSKKFESFSVPKTVLLAPKLTLVAAVSDKRVPRYYRNGAQGSRTARSTQAPGMSG